MSRAIGTIRRFRTAQFTVIVDALPEDDLDLSWDDDGSTRAGLESGRLQAFTVRARVVHKDMGEIAGDYLGGCIYESLADFMDHKECGKANRGYAARGDAGRCGSYFADMVATVCREAREAIRKAQTVRVRS
jgi:hypothetical protein